MHLVKESHRMKSTHVELWEFKADWIQWFRSTNSTVWAICKNRSVRHVFHITLSMFTYLVWFTDYYTVRQKKWWITCSKKVWKLGLRTENRPQSSLTRESIATCFGTGHSWFRRGVVFIFNHSVVSFESYAHRKNSMTHIFVCLSVNKRLFHS